MHDEHDEEHAARQAPGRARLSFEKEGRAFTRLARLRRAARRAPRRPSFFRLGRSGGDGFGAGPALSVKGAEEFGASRPDNAPYTKLVLSVAALAEPRLPGAGGRASRPHPLVRKGRAGAQLQARRDCGVLLLGVEDRTRSVRGVREPLDLEERLANLVSDLIVPRLMPEIEILAWRRTQLLAVQVHPSPARPHFLKREGPTDGVYVRVGSTNRRADREMVEELRRYARGEAFDEQPMPGLGSEAVDFRAASESFARVRKLARRDLETLRLSRATRAAWCRRWAA